MSLEITVWVRNLSNNEEREILLPIDEDVLEEELRDLCPNGEDFIIASYEAPFEVGEHDNLLKLSEAIEELERKNVSWRDVEALIELEGDLKDAVTTLQNGATFYHLDEYYDSAARRYSPESKPTDELWADLARLLVEEYDYFGERVPAYLRDHINWDSVAAQIQTETNIFLASNGVFVSPHK